MSLDEYRRKRRFHRTPEPPGADTSAAQASAKHGRFVVQKHAAGRLHYDLRLELDGVLKSWAIPKGPSLDPADKRLAIHVEDHPLEYLDFEGAIPHNEYGGGTVLIWDAGTWQPVEENGYSRGELKFELDGRKLQGRWMLVHTGRRGGDPQHWLFFKERDNSARDRSELDVLAAHPESVLTGRTIEQVAADAVGTKDNAVRPTQAEAMRKTRRQTDAADDVSGQPRLKPAGIRGSRRQSMPQQVRPMLPSATRAAPTGDQWLHEIKYDGYRMFCHVRNRAARFTSRNGNDWTDKLPRLAELLANLAVDQAIFDGEVVAMAADGTTDFQALQNTIGRGSDRRLRYYVFDLLYLDGYDLTGACLAERKQLLRQLIPVKENSQLQFSEHILGDGPTVFQHACRLGAEGIVSKRVDRKYLAGRTKDWLKTKSLRTADFVIAGYTESTATRSGFGALVLGAYDNAGQLVYLGRVGTGFSDQTREALWDYLWTHELAESPFPSFAAGTAPREVHWVAPELVAEVEFGGWTDDRLLRFPTFRGIRADIAVAEVTVEEATSQTLETAVTSELPLDDLKPFQLTHPDRVMYPDCGVTKLGVATHYAHVAARMLPHLVNRPLSLVRCPRGCQEKCFFQKGKAQGMPEVVEAVKLSLDGQRTQSAIFIRDLAGLLALVQFSTLEFHTWGCQIDRPDRPDRLVFDFDPDVALPFSRVGTAALEMRDILAALGLESFVKTTGGNGLHVVVPIRRTISWSELYQFASGLAARMEGASPGRYTTSSSKRARAGKIYIDYLRNSFGATSIAAYSTRARPGAGVATPVAWAELATLPAADCFTVRNINRRLLHQPVDPWAKMAEVRQTITKRMLND